MYSGFQHLVVVFYYKTPELFQWFWKYIKKPMSKM